MSALARSWILWRSLGLLALIAVCISTATPRIVTRLLNPTISSGLPQPTSETINFHSELSVADLHADALLWDLDLLTHRSSGHIDIPRLEKGRVALESFTVVTKSPFGQNIWHTSADSDLITLLTVLQAWPIRTWANLTERALHQAKKLQRTADNSGGRLTLVQTRNELDDVLRRREEVDNTIGAILGIEGAHALEHDLTQLERLYHAGFRSVGLTHFFDNEVGGSAHGLSKGGLTDFGMQVVVRMEELGMAIDLAHASPSLVKDILRIARRPVLVSHTGVKGTCDNERNIGDEALRGVAATGGLVGIGLWPEAICGDTAADWVQAVHYAAEIAGIDHVGLGSDWDGAVPTIVDASGTIYLVQALLDNGFERDEVRKIMGNNAIRVFRQTLPAR